MDKNTLEVLNYNEIKESIKEYTSSGLGKNLVDKMDVKTNMKTIKSLLQETKEAITILDDGNFSLKGIIDIQKQIKKIKIGGILEAVELSEISDFLRSSRNIKKHMKLYEFKCEKLYSYSLVIENLKDLEEIINTSISGNSVLSKASNKLLKIRRKISIQEQKIIDRLEKVINSNKNYLQEKIYSIKDNRYVIAVKSEYKNQVNGNIITKSNRGTTVFIEPSSVSKLVFELNILKSEEEEEIYQILATLTGLIDEHLRIIELIIDLMSTYDFIFARAKYSKHIKGNEIKLIKDEYFDLKQAKHPLLGELCIPIDIKLGKDFRTLLITGPNTGGKTVALKILGISILLVQSGIFPPVKKDSIFSVLDNIFVDIGDNQDINNSLSTFSSHMKNLIQIIKNSKRKTLILVDEIGTGTDPKEGAALGISILEEFYKRGAITMATTHYGEIKEYADKHNDFENASMAFDKQTLKPKYKLIIGIAGESNGFYISKNLGLEKTVLNRAKKYLNEEKTNLNFDNIAKKKFKTLKKTDEIIVKKDYEKLNKGDIVIILENKKEAIVYEGEDKNNYVNVFYNDEYKKILRKRLKLKLKADVLYPLDYDLEQLFIPFALRKLNKDIKRGGIYKLKDIKKIEESIK